MSGNRYGGAARLKWDAVRAEPQRPARRTQRDIDDTEHVTGEARQVDLVAELLGERCGRPIRVIAVTVEATVHRLLDAAPSWLEERSGHDR